MDRDVITALIAALEASALSELEYSSGGSTLRLVKGAPGQAAVARAAVAVARPALPEPGGADAAIRAPQFGVVHLQRTPGTPPLVAAGQAVAAGQVLCLIEAMKTFTELRASRAGTVAAVLVRSGEEVEAGQALFRLE